MTKKKLSAPLPTSKATNAYDLLTDVRKLILEDPLRYDQHHWFTPAGIVKKRPACKTVCCVAGWVATLRPHKGITVRTNACVILGLNEKQTHELFAASASGCSQPQTRAHARAGAAHIRRFQQKHAAQLKAKAV